MITAYHRPETMERALALLEKPGTLPMGGGTLLSRTEIENLHVVDLQSLGLNTIEMKGNELVIGATATLQEFHEFNHCPAPLKEAIRLEAPYNLRNSATVAGTIASCDGRSTLVTSLLALDARVEFYEPGAGKKKSVKARPAQTITNDIPLGEYLPMRPKGLITRIILSKPAFAFEFVSRTPADKPIVCAALARWNSGRTRLTLGGYGKAPLLAMDGTESEGLEVAARNAYHEATDEWASAEYRMEVAAILAKRCLDE